MDLKNILLGKIFPGCDKLDTKSRQDEYQWDVMPLIRMVSNFVFSAALYWSCLGFNALLALPTKEADNKGLK